MLASALILAQAQRLFRRLCPACKHGVDITVKDLKDNHFNIEGLDFESRKIFEPGKCTKCNQGGYKGRGGIMEIMEVKEIIRELIMKNANDNDLRRAAVAQGMITLQRAGLNKVFDGFTSIDEILRITSTV
jgi:type IV pilus assembly protein PilB